MSDEPKWRDKDFEDYASWLGGEFEIRGCRSTYADARTHCMWCCWQEGKKRATPRWWEFWK